MTRRNLSLFVLFVSLTFIFIGCEEANPSGAGGSSEALDQAHGSWEFEDGTSVVLAVDPDEETNFRDFYVDLERETTIYHIEGSGTLEGTTITGTYTYTTDTTAEKDLGSLRETSNESYNISITLEQEGDTVTVSCTGEGPLADETFQGGSEPTYTSADLYGDWLFPDGTIFSVGTYDGSENNATIHIVPGGNWDDGYTGLGVLNSETYTGTYYHPSSDSSDSNITIYYSFSGSWLTIGADASSGPFATNTDFVQGIKTRDE
ncbi:MAG: hypothetical protein RBQ89_06110 [Sphaerochaeta sp.]|nr:hypothetical protein [Sphaerochaeta sp.]